MFEKGKVSICVPTYNRPNLIQELLDSILSQTYQNFEIIITDNSDNLVTEQLIGSKYSDDRIRYFKNEKNLGMDGNTLKALNFISGEFFTFTPDDDIWTDSGKLEKQVNFLNAAIEVNICFSNLIHINFDGSIHKNQFKLKRRGKFACEVVESSSLLLTTKNSDFVNIMTAVVRSNQLEIFKRSWTFGSEEYFMWYVGGTGQGIGYCFDNMFAHRDGDHNWQISDGSGKLINYRKDSTRRAKQLANIYADLMILHGRELILFSKETEVVIFKLLVKLIGLSAFEYRKTFRRLTIFSNIYFFAYAILYGALTPFKSLIKR